MTRALLILIFLFALPALAMSPCDELLSARVQLQQKWVGGKISEAVYRNENKILDEKEKAIDATEAKASEIKTVSVSESPNQLIQEEWQLKPHPAREAQFQKATEAAGPIWNINPLGTHTLHHDEEVRVGDQQKSQVFDLEKMSPQGPVLYSALNDSLKTYLTDGSGRLLISKEFDTKKIYTLVGPDGSEWKLPKPFVNGPINYLYNSPRPNRLLVTQGKSAYLSDGNKDSKIIPLPNDVEVSRLIVNAYAFDPDKPQFVSLLLDVTSGFPDYRIEIRRENNGEIIDTISLNEEGMTGIGINNIRISDGIVNMLVDKSRIFQVDLKTKEIQTIKILDDLITSTDYPNDFNLVHGLLAHIHDTHIELMDLQSGESLQKIETDDRCHEVIWSQDGHELWCIPSDGRPLAFRLQLVKKVTEAVE